MKNNYKPEYTNTPKKLKLKGLGYLGHYFFVLLVLFPVMLTVYDFIKHLNGTYNGVRPIEELLDGTEIFILIAFVILVIQYNRLKFKSIETSLTPKKILSLCAKFAGVNNLAIKYVSKNEFVATSNRSAIFAWGQWGEMLTVIILDKKVYINSICDPYKRPNIITMGKNNAYKRALIKTIKHASA